MIAAAGATDEQAGEVLRLAAIAGDNDEVLRQLEPLVAGSETGPRRRGAARPKCSPPSRRPAWPRERIKLDVSIARGLDYYTGTVFETFLDALPGIGSVCSGGRYDNLAELFTKQELPGIGASLGLDRLLAAMEELGMIEKVATPAPVLHPLLRRGPAARLPAAGRRAAGRGARRRGLSRAEEARPATQVRRSPRLPRRADRRRERIRRRRLPGQGPRHRRAPGRAAGARRPKRRRGDREDPCPPRTGESITVAIVAFSVQPSDDARVVRAVRRPGSRC